MSKNRIIPLTTIVGFILIFIISTSFFIVKSKKFNSPNKEYSTIEEALLNYPWLDPNLDDLTYPGLGYGGASLSENCYPISFASFEYHHSLFTNDQFKTTYILSTTVICGINKYLPIPGYLFGTFNIVIIEKQQDGMYKVTETGTGG